MMSKSYHFFIMFQLIDKEKISSRKERRQFHFIL